MKRRIEWILMKWAKNYLQKRVERIVYVSGPSVADPTGVIGGWICGRGLYDLAECPHQSSRWAITVPAGSQFMTGPMLAPIATDGAVYTVPKHVGQIVEVPKDCTVVRY